LNFDTPDTLVAGRGYFAVVAERLATSLSALATPGETVLPLPEVPPDVELLLLEPHPASTADAAINAAHGASHRFPVSIIAHASITLRSTTVA